MTEQRRTRRRTALAAKGAPTPRNHAAVVAEAKTAKVAGGGARDAATGGKRGVDGGASWSANLAGPELPGMMITRIETHPSEARDVYITEANFGNSHVFRSVDAGSRWSDLDRGRLPDAPHHALLIRPDVRIAAAAALERVLAIAQVAGPFADLGAERRDLRRRVRPWRAFRCGTLATALPVL